jgi:hypothetical protein
MRVSELIKELQQLKAELGDIPVIHQRDPEGNGYGTITSRSVCVYNESSIGKFISIEPFDEYIEDRLFNY